MKKLNKIIIFSLLAFVFATFTIMTSFSSGNIPDSYESIVKSDTNLK